MNNLKKLSIGSAILGLCAASSFADIKIDSNLTINGFFDMSTGTHANAFTAPGAPPSATSNNHIWGSFDQFEIDFMYKYGDHLSARADVNALPSSYTVGGGTSGAIASAVTLEQAYLTYTEGAAAVSVGRFLSVSGWECAEPTCLYQYDYSDAFVYAGYENGLNLAYTVSPMISLYGAIVTDAFGAPDGNLKTPGEEAQIGLTPTKEITVKGTYVGQWIAAATDYQQSLFNVWASYSMGPLVAAAEGDYLMNWNSKSNNGYGYLAMANYHFLPKLAATVRYSGMKTTGGGTATLLNSEVTVSPSYNIADNWWVLLDAKYQINFKEAGFAAETTFTF